MDYQTMMRQQEKNRGPFEFGHLATQGFNHYTKQAAESELIRYRAHLSSYPNHCGAIDGIKKYEDMLKKNYPESELLIKEITVKADDTPTKKRAKKEKIPATLKNILWHKYFEASLTGLCQCCKVENISKAIFDAGHIISEANGGQVVLDNLKPICKLCNSSMGKTNMDDFMKKYGI